VCTDTAWLYKHLHTPVLASPRIAPPCLSWGGRGKEESTYTRALRSLQRPTSGTNQSCRSNCIVLRLNCSSTMVRTSRGGTAAPPMGLEHHPCYPSLSHTPLTLLTDMPESWMPDGYPDQQPDELTSYVKILVDTQTRGETAEPLPHLQMPWPRTSPRHQSCSQESRKRSARSRSAETSDKGRKSRQTMSRGASLNKKHRNPV
jgi:hypothetical protein